MYVFEYVHRRQFRSRVERRVMDAMFLRVKMLTFDNNFGVVMFRCRSSHTYTHTHSIHHTNWNSVYLYCVCVYCSYFVMQRENNNVFAVHCSVHIFRWHFWHIHQNVKSNTHTRKKMRKLLYSCVFDTQTWYFHLAVVTAAPASSVRLPRRRRFDQFNHSFIPFHSVHSFSHSAMLTFNTRIPKIEYVWFMIHHHRQRHRHSAECAMTVSNNHDRNNNNNNNSRFYSFASISHATRLFNGLIVTVFFFFGYYVSSAPVAMCVCVYRTMSCVCDTTGHFWIK